MWSCPAVLSLGFISTALQIHVAAASLMLHLDKARVAGNGREPGDEDPPPGGYELSPDAEKQYEGITSEADDDEDHEAGEGRQEAGEGHHDAGEGHHDAGAGHHEAGAGHHEAGEGHGEATVSAANCLAVGMVAVVTISPVVLHMALQPGMHGYLTLKLMDTFISIFISILWYQVFDQAMETFDFEGKYGFNLLQTFKFVCVIIAYGVAVGLAHLLQYDEVYLTTSTGIGSHYVAFAIVGTGGHVQAAVSGRGVWASFLFVGVVVVGIASYSAMIEALISTQKKTLRAAVEEMEKDIIGLTTSFLLTQCVRQVITGSHPGMSLLELATKDIHPPLHHPTWQKLFMLAWSVALTVVSVVVVPRLREGLHGQRKFRKAVHAFKALVIMMVAWGYMLWGEWLFFEEIYKGSMMYGHMLFALIATSIGLAVLWLFAGAADKRNQSTIPGVALDIPLVRSLSMNVTEALGQESFRRTCNISVTSISLVIAWSWEHCFSMAFDIIGAHYEVGYSGLVPKTCLAFVIPCFLLPSYVLHVKPRVIAGTKGYISRSESEGGEDAAPAVLPGHAEEVAY